MKKLALVLALCCAGCPKHPEAVDAGGLPPGAPRPVDEAEPNDDLAHAQKLAGAVNVAAKLQPAPGKKADDDWYALDPALGHAMVSVDPAPPLDVAVEVYDADGVKRLSQDGAPGGGSEVLHGLLVARAGLVHVFSRKGETGAYHLTVQPEPADGSQEDEPDNRAVDATPLTPGQPLRGFLTDSADEDWFKLVLPGGSDGGTAPDAGIVDGGAPIDAGAVDAGPSDAGASDGGFADAGATYAPPPPQPPPLLLHLAISGAPGVRLELSVVNAANAAVFSTRAKNPGEPIEVRNLALRGEARDWFVVVRSAWMGSGKEARRGASDQPYTLSADVAQAQGEVELEPNDDAEHATPVDLSTGSASLEGYLTPKTDEDWYLLKSSQPVIARVEVSGVEHLDLELSAMRVPDAGRPTALLTANDGELKEPEVLTNLAVGPQGTYVRVQGAARKSPEGKWVRDTENPKDPYRLSVTTQPDDGTREREPNNVPEVATPIALGQTLRGTIHPKRDVDFYQLDLSSQPVKTNLKATVSGILKVDVALYLYRQKPDGALGLVQTSDTAKGDAPESITFAADPGVYFLKVKDTRDRESNFVDSYALRVEAQ